MDITFKFRKHTQIGWDIGWSENGKPIVSLHSSRTKAVNKMLRLIAPELRDKDSFEVTYHIP